MPHKRLIMPLAALLTACSPAVTLAHGFAGKHFFPSTLTVNDAFVSDELGLQLQRKPRTEDHPLTGHSRQAGLSSASIEISKRLTERLQISIADSYMKPNPRGGQPAKGLGNVVLGVRMQGPVRADAEAAVSAGLNVVLGGSGSDAVNNSSYTTFSPTFTFAQGFGTLAKGAQFLRPLGLTGAIAYNYPTRGSAPRTLDTGFTVQYSLPYLQSTLKGASLPPLIRNLTPLVEFPFEVCLDHGCGATLAGSVNPGLIWATRYGQLGLEAMFPIDSRSGKGTGGMLQLRAYLGQIFPRGIGAPVFGRVFNKAIE